MIDRSDWVGLLHGRRATVAELTAQAFLADAHAGSAGAFPCRTTNGQHFFLKTLNNQQGPRVPITEQIVGRIAALINAPACDVRTIEIPDGLIGFEFVSGVAVESGIAHGSAQVVGSRETRDLGFRTRDDNRIRHCGIMALYDWAWGDDAQWLVAELDDKRFYSHDHGWYLPPEGAFWDAVQLEALVDEPHELEDAGWELNPIVARIVAEQLLRVTRTALVETLAAIPAAWPVTDEELESAGFFLERRAPDVAARLQRRFGGTS